MRCAWGPILLFISGLAGTADELVAAMGNGTSPGQRRFAPFDKTVKCFPNWTPPTVKEIRAWTKGFELNEELLAAYVCTVPARLRHHGRLYLSTGHVCFTGVGAVTHVLNFVLTLDDIDEICHGGSRDVATIKLKHTLTLKGFIEPVKSIKLLGCEDGCAALASLLARHRGEVDEEDDNDNDNNEAIDAPSSPRLKPPRASAGPALPKLPPPSCAAAAILDDRTPFQPIMTANLPLLQLGPLAQDLLANEWGDCSLVVDLYRRQGGTEIRVSACVDLGTPASGPSPVGSLVQVRELTLRIPVPPGPMCPETTRMTTTFRLSATPATDDSYGQGFNAVTIESSCVSHDIPFGENFCVQERVEFIPSPTGRGVQVTKSFRCVFLRSVGLLASTIRSFTSRAQVKSGDVLVTALQSRTSGSAALARAPSKTNEQPGDEVQLDSLQTTCTVHIWELQRRATLFHTDWHAPFLPHDGQKRWRWVDTSYQKHPWTRCSQREAAAVADTPPIGPQENWEPQGDWTICTGSSDSTGDEDGWQYAIDFYLDEWWWTPTLHAQHVRRRLWARNFAKVEHPH